MTGYAKSVFPTENSGCYLVTQGLCGVDFIIQERRDLQLLFNEPEFQISQSQYSDLSLAFLLTIKQLIRMWHMVCFIWLMDRTRIT